MHFCHRYTCCSKPSQKQETSFGPHQKYSSCVTCSFDTNRVHLMMFLTLVSFPQSTCEAHTRSTHPWSQVRLSRYDSLFQWIFNNVGNRHLLNKLVIMNRFIDTQIIYALHCHRPITSGLIVLTGRAWVLRPAAMYPSLDGVSVHTCFVIHSTHSPVNIDWCNTFCCKEFDHRTIFQQHFHIARHSLFHCSDVSGPTCNIKKFMRRRAYRSYFSM